MGDGRGLDDKVLAVYELQGGTLAWRKDYVYANGRHLGAVSQAEGVRHFTVDHLGSIRLITNSQGTVVGYHAYYPFGEEAGTTPDGEVMKFTGHERDFNGSITASMQHLDSMHARYYNPNLARFLSPDPGRDNHPSQPQSWNLYAYTRGNPMKYVDPDGRLVKAAVAKALGSRATAGGITGGVAGLAWYLKRSGLRGERVTLAGSANALVKGSVVGGANALPVVGSVTAAFCYDFIEQRLTGASAKDAVDHAAVVALATGVLSLFTAADSTNLLAGSASGYAANAGKEIFVALGIEIPLALDPPHGSSDMLKERIDQQRELTEDEQGFVGNSTIRSSESPRRDQ